MTAPIQQLFQEYMYECEFVQKLRPETLRSHEQAFATFFKLVPDISSDTLSAPAILRFFKLLNERKRIVGKGRLVSTVKKSTIATYWSKFNTFFEWLKLKGHITENPLATLTRPTPRYEDKKYLKKHDIEKILTAILLHSNSTFLVKRNLVILYLFLLCGLRREELIELQVRDIDLQKRMLTVRAETSKAGRTRYVPIHSQLNMALNEYLKARNKYSSPYLLVSSNRDYQLTKDGLQHLIAILVKYSGVKFHMHQFRHTFAVNFLKSSNNIAKLQQLLGHKSVSMTLQYVRCLPPQEMRRDIESLSIDTFL